MGISDEREVTATILENKASILSRGRFRNHSFTLELCRVNHFVTIAEFLFSSRMSLASLYNLITRITSKMKMFFNYQRYDKNQFLIYKRQSRQNIDDLMKKNDDLMKKGRRIRLPKAPI